MEDMKKAPKLSSAERSELEILHTKGYSMRRIASVLGRSPNTISSELKRNMYQKTGSYDALVAKHKAYVNRKYARYQGKKIQENDALRSFIITKLSEHWNPDEIAGFLRIHPELGFYASKTAIYEWLRSARGQSYCQYLYSRRYRVKKRRGASVKRIMIPNRASIDQRPAAADLRSEVGHLEYDAIVSCRSSNSTHALVVEADRCSRFTLASIVPNLKPQEYAEAVVSMNERHRVLQRSFTGDNGQENRAHETITEQTGANVYFTNPYSPWQKGTVENCNKMLRRYFPKGTDFANISQTEVDEVVSLINNKPRKVLGYKSATEVAIEKGLITSGVLIEG